MVERPIVKLKAENTGRRVLQILHLFRVRAEEITRLRQPPARSPSRSTVVFSKSWSSGGVEPEGVVEI